MIKETLTDLEVDALRELMNIGAGQGISALSKLVGVGIFQAVPTVRTAAPGNELPLAPDLPQPGRAVTQLVSGAFHGSVVVAAGESACIHLANRLLGTEQPTGDLSLEGQRALSEAFSIVVAAYAAAAGTVVGELVTPTPPVLASSPAAVLMRELVDGEPSVVASTEFTAVDGSMGGNIVLVLNADNAGRLLELMGVAAVAID